MELNHNELITLVPHEMFGERQTINESLDYAEIIAKSSESYLHSITPWFVLFNTIAKNYYLIPKSLVEDEKS